MSPPGMRLRPPCGPRGRVVAWLAAVLAAGSCDPDPSTAVIALHGVPSDEIFWAARADSLAALPNPIHVEVFDPAESSPGTYTWALGVGNEISALEGIVGVVGHRDSRSTLVMGPIYRDAGLPIVVPNATSTAIQELGTGVFRMVPDDREQGSALAHALERMGARRIVLFHVDDEYGVGIRDGLLGAISPLISVLDVVEYGVQRSACPEHFLPFVDAALLDGTPDVVVLASRPLDGGCIVRLMTERAPDVRFLAADGVEPIPEFRTNAGDAAQAVTFVRFWSEEGNPALQAFRAHYQELSGGYWDTGVPLRFDGVRLLQAAVAEVGADPDAVQRWLQGLGTRRPSFLGLTGEISFAPGFRRAIYLVDLHGRPPEWTGR